MQAMAAEKAAMLAEIERLRMQVAQVRLVGRLGSCGAVATGQVVQGGLVGCSGVPGCAWQPASVLLQFASTHMPAIAPYRLQVSTGPPAPVPAPPAAAPAAVLPVPGPLGLPLGVPPALPSCLSQLAEELSPADALGSGRLPPLIEQAQRLAEKRVSAQGGG